MIKIYLIVLTCMFQANLSKAGEPIVITVEVGDNQALIDAINVANAVTKKSNIESASPVTIIQRNDIEDTYVVSISDLINNQPSFIDLGIPTQLFSSQGQLQFNGCWFWQWYFNSPTSDPASWYHLRFVENNQTRGHDLVSHGHF